MSEIHYERAVVREMLEEKLRASIQRVSFGTIRSVDDLSLWLDRGFASVRQRLPKETDGCAEPFSTSDMQQLRAHFQELMRETPARSARAHALTTLLEGCDMVLKEHFGNAGRLSMGAVEEAKAAPAAGRGSIDLWSHPSILGSSHPSIRRG
ncbi:MAG: hypothetical protein DI582_01915 [Azospirillum brasilense]|nr:MAG: hypothetical protein DI582_01915 [Azospirillum brasilense]